MKDTIARVISDYNKEDKKKAKEVISVKAQFEFPEYLERLTEDLATFQKSLNEKLIKEGVITNYQLVEQVERLDYCQGPISQISQTRGLTKNEKTAILHKKQDIIQNFSESV